MTRLLQIALWLILGPVLLALFLKGEHDISESETDRPNHGYVSRAQ